VFRAKLLGSEEASWEELFAGYAALKAITFSSSIEMLLRLADRLADVEVVFGSESILSKEHLALAQASQTIQSYRFGDALIDQKALVEALSRFLGSAGRKLLERVVAGTLRFRLPRGRPSHEKLYLLTGRSLTTCWMQESRWSIKCQARCRRASPTWDRKVVGGSRAARCRWRSPAKPIDVSRPDSATRRKRSAHTRRRSPQRSWDAG
jgi:hypothetical protein